MKKTPRQPLGDKGYPVIFGGIRKPANRVRGIRGVAQVKTELEQSDIQAIATAVADLLKPCLPAEKQGPDDEVFDRQGFADYLHVEVSWVDKQITKRAWPVPGPTLKEQPLSRAFPRGTPPSDCLK